MRLNINLDRTLNYDDLQTQVVDEIIHGLDETDILTFTRRDIEPDCLNLTFFIRQMGQVFLSHSLADRNYLLSKSEDGPLLTRFQAVLVPGEWSRRAILSRPALGFSPHRVVAVGHPRIDLLRRMQARTEPRPTLVPGARRRILWAPAHDRHGGPKKCVVSSYPGFEAHLSDLQDRHNVVISLHPRNRSEDKYALTRPLIDCDVVITDVSSVMFEAWALGKPVIFPRWLLRDGVSQRFPGSAEAYIHDQRIGLHADSYSEMLDMLAAGPVIGDDVQAFMDDYLITYRNRDSSAERIIRALQKVADPDWLSRILQQDAGLAAMAAAAGRKGAVATRTGGARASIQMLQLLALQDQPEGFVHAISALRSVQSGSRKLQADIAAIECDYRLVATPPDRRTALLARLDAADAGMAKALRSRLAVLGGQTDEAFDLLQQASKGAQGYASWRLVPRLMQLMGHEDKALPVLEKLWAQYKGREVAEDMLALARNKAEAARVLALLRGARKLMPLADFHDLHMRALWQAGQIEEALDAARHAAIEAARLDPGWRLKDAPPIEGWGPKDGLPVWHLPFEALDSASVAQGQNRWKSALAAICAVIEAEDLPLFLSRATLRHFLSDTIPDSMRTPVELGLIAGPDGAAVLERLAHAALLEPLQDDRPQDARCFRMLNGVMLVVRFCHPQEDGTLLLCEDGVDTSLPALTLTPETRSGVTARIPAARDSYLDAVFGAEDPEDRACVPLMSGRATRITDPDRLRFRLYREVIAALGADDPGRARAYARILYRLGDKDYWVHLGRMDKFHFCEDLPGLMEEARFIMHIGDGIDAAFHVDLWYPYLKSVDPSTILAIRSKPLFELLRRTRPELHAIYIKAGLEAEWLVSNCPKLVGVHYVSNTGNTVHFLRFNHVTHVFLGHGDSEKAASSHKFFRAYDEVWTAGRAHIDRFRATGMNHDGLRFRIVGRPTLRGLLQAEPDGRSFLYLPTWEGFQAEQDYTSIRASEDFIPAVAELTGLGAVVKFHPWAGKRALVLNEIEARLGNPSGEMAGSIEVAGRTEPAAERMQAASFLISDISSVVSDFLPTGRPIFLFVPKDRQVRTSTSSMPMESYCYVYHDMASLMAQIRRVIVEGDDWLRDTRLKARDYFVDAGRTAGLAFEQTLRDLIAEHENPAHAWAAARPETPATEARPQPKVIGHRGAKGLWPENALSGFAETARMNGLDGVEFDLQLSADGEIVILHDPVLQRTTTGHGAVGLRTLDKLRALRLVAGTKKDPEVLDETIPTLDEVLAILGPTGLELHVELKTDALGSPYPGLAEKALEQIHAAGLAGRSILTCFAPEVLEEVRALDRNIPLLASVNFRSMEMLGGPLRCLERFDRIPGCALALDHAVIERLLQMYPDAVDLRRVGVWVLNTEEAIQTAIDQGVRQITSDRPDIVIDLLKKEAPHERQTA